MVLCAMGIAKEVAENKVKRNEEVNKLVMDFTVKDKATGRKGEVRTEQGNNRVMNRVHRGAPMVIVVPKNSDNWEEVTHYQESNKRYWVEIGTRGEVRSNAKRIKKEVKRINNRFKKILWMQDRTSRLERVKNRRDILSKITNQ